MANHKSAEKRIRSTQKKTRFNKRVISALRTCQKVLSKNLEEKNIKEMGNNLKLLFKLTDRAEKRGIIKKNKASRTKARFSSKIHNLSS